MLIAVDTLEQMSLVFETENGMATDLVGPTVYAVGGDDRYIVAKRHPNEDARSQFDRSVTEYFVVTRTNSSSSKERQANVRGPLTKEEFEQLRASQRLPDFTKTIADLQ